MELESLPASLHDRPMWDGSNRIYRCIRDQLRYSQEPESSRKKAARVGLKTLSLVPALGGHWSYLRPTARAAKGVKWYAILLQYGNVTSWSVITIWAAWQIIDEEMDGKEGSRPRACSSCFGSGVRLIAATTIGVLALAPGAILVDRENHDEWWQSVIVLSCDSIVPIYSVWSALSLCSLNGSLSGWRLPCIGDRRRDRSPLLSKLDQAGRMLRKGLAQKLQIVMHLPKETRRRYLDAVEALRSYVHENERDAVAEFVASAMPDRLPDVKEPSLKFRALKRLACLSGTVLFAGLSTVIWEYTRRSVDDGLDNDWVAGTSATAVTLCWAKLTYESVIEAPANLLQSARDWWVGDSVPRAGFALHPILTSCLGLAALITAALGNGPMMESAEEDFSGAPEVVFQAVGGAAISVMLLHAMLDVLQDVVEAGIEHLGSEDERDLLRLSRNIRRLSAAIEESSCFEIAEMVHALPESTRRDLCERLGIASRDLQEYARRDRDGAPRLAESV